MNYKKILHALQDNAQAHTISGNGRKNYSSTFFFCNFGAVYNLTVHHKFNIFYTLFFSNFRLFFLFEKLIFLHPVIEMTVCGLMRCLSKGFFLLFCYIWFVFSSINVSFKYFLKKVEFCLWARQRRREIRIQL